MKAMKRAFPWPIFWDTLALFLWGLMILRYWWSGRLAVLLHPDYHWLAIGAGWTLLFMAVWRSTALVRYQKGIDTPHIALLPRQWSLAVLLAVAVFGLIYVPRPFASDAALARGIADPVGLTRSQPQRFARNTPPEERSLIDWIRTLNVYPEPDAYAGQPVNVTGFVIHPPNWSDNYVMVARFVLTCCAADAYPVGLPVKLSGDRSQFAPDSWISVQGEMMTETLDDQRRLVIQPETVLAVPEPKNPYEF
jgi:uncharacterized repeat protein (TIGR03943 family)